MLLSLSPIPPAAVASRNKSAEITISSGSINTAPSVPSRAAAERLPPASSTSRMAENSTNPPSPLVPPSAERRAPRPKIAASSAKVMTVPPSELAPTPSAERSAPDDNVISSPARTSTLPASMPAAPSAPRRPAISTSSSALIEMPASTPDKSTIAPDRPDDSRLMRLSIETTALVPVSTRPVTRTSLAVIAAPPVALIVPLTDIRPCDDNGTWLSWTSVTLGALIIPLAPNILFMKSWLGVTSWTEPIFMTPVAPTMMPCGFRK